MRIESDDQGTLGFLYTPGFSCYMLELPWKNNQVNVSCIPVGTYVVKIKKSPKYGVVYWITDVPGRTFIYQHAGNLAGDVSMGFKTDTEGCQLFGRYYGVLQNQRAILNSRFTMNNFMKFTNGKDYLLTIKNG